MPHTNTQTRPQTPITDDKPIIDPCLENTAFRGDFITSGAMDWAYTSIAGAYGVRLGPSRLSRRTPIRSILTSGGIGLSVIVLRELVVSPLVLAAGIGSPHLRERQSLYAIERKALLLSGDDEVRKLTKDLHKVNDAYRLNRVWETGIAGVLASFMVTRIQSLRPQDLVRSLPARLWYGVVMMAGQLAYNSISMKHAETAAYAYHSHPRTSQELGVEINEHLKTHANLDELHREFDTGRIADEYVQVQKELSVVRRALALNSSQK